MLGGGKKLTQDNVDGILKQYLKSMVQPKFYMCTDDSAINHLEKEMNVKNKFLFFFNNFFLIKLSQRNFLI